MVTERVDLTDDNGTRYEGLSIENGIPQGSGKMTFSDGLIYEGHFEHGIPNGVCKVVTADKYIYEGDVKNWKMQGQGVLTSPEQLVVEGYFENNQPIGDVKVTHKDGTTYIEYYEDGTCKHRTKLDNKEEFNATNSPNMNRDHSGHTVPIFKSILLSGGKTCFSDTVLKRHENRNRLVEEIECPYCKNSLKIIREKIPIHGGRVKCSKCNDRFTVFSHESNFWLPGIGVLAWGEHHESVRDKYQSDHTVIVDHFVDYELVLSFMDPPDKPIALDFQFFYKWPSNELTRIAISNYPNTGIHMDYIFDIIEKLDKYYSLHVEEYGGLRWKNESTEISVDYRDDDLFDENIMSFMLIFKERDKEIIQKEELLKKLSKRLKNILISKDVISLIEFIAQGNSVDYYQDTNAPTPLCDAIDSKHSEMVVRILNNITEPSVMSSSTENVDSAIDKSLKLQNDNLFIKLIDKIIELEGGNQNDKLLAMIEYGTYRHVTNLIDECSDINYRGSNGEAAIHKAVYGNRHQIIQYLLQAGADIDLQTESGNKGTPAQLALCTYTTFNLLLNNGADLHIPNRDGLSVFEIVDRISRLKGNDFKKTDDDDDNYDWIEFMALDVPDEVIDLVQLHSMTDQKYVISYKRTSLSSKVKREVWRRDQGMCVECGSNIKLEYDHIIPVSKGGSNTVRNIQLLCEFCNRTKSNKIM